MNAEMQLVRNWRLKRGGGGPIDDAEHPSESNINLATPEMMHACRLATQS